MLVAIDITGTGLRTVVPLPAWEALACMIPADLVPGIEGWFRHHYGDDEAAIAEALAEGNDPDMVARWSMLVDKHGSN